MNTQNLHGHNLTSHPENIAILHFAITPLPPSDSVIIVMVSQHGPTVHTTVILVYLTHKSYYI